MLTRLRQSRDRFVRRLLLSAATDPGADGARGWSEVITPRGYEEAYSRKIDSVWRRTLTERRRFIDYRDDFSAAERNIIVHGAFVAMSQDATAQPFEIQCSSARGKYEAEKVLERTKYWEYRSQLLYLLNLLGDHFLVCDYDTTPSRKRNIAEIRGIRSLPAWSMFRLADEQGAFPDWGRAYMQIPSVELVPVGGGDFSNGSLLWNGTRFYAGTPASGSPYGFLYPGSERVHFRIEEIIHSRLNPWLKSGRDGYGLSARRSSRKATDIASASIQDAAMGRKLSTYNRIHHKVGAGMGADEFKEYKAQIEGKEPSPWTQYVTRGEVDILAVDAENKQLTNIDDLHLHISLAELGHFYPMALLGFRAERISGEVADRLEQRLKTTIAFQHDLEESQAIRPLVERQFMYSGLSGVEFDVIWPHGPRPEDMNKFAKRVHTAVQLKIISRGRAGEILFSLTPAQAEAELARIESEVKKLGEPGMVQSRPETSEKGKKGVENKSSSEQDISDTENISDEDKDA